METHASKPFSTSPCSLSIDTETIPFSVRMALFHISDCIQIYSSARRYFAHLITTLLAIGPFLSL